MMEPFMGNSFNFGIQNFKQNALDDIVVDTVLHFRILIEKKFAYTKDGYGIYQGETEFEHVIKVAGVFPSPLVEGSTYDITGKVGVYKGEKQLYVDTVKPAPPATRNGIISYLKNLKGLYKYGEWLYELYDKEIMDILINDPMLIVKEIPEIPHEYVESWKEDIQKYGDETNGVAPLLELGLNLRQAKVLLDTYPQDAIERIRENPYLIVRDIPSFGFVAADKLAQQLGYPPEGTHRIQEGIKFALLKINEQGHCFLPLDQIVQKVKSTLDIRLNQTEMTKYLKEFKGKRHCEVSVGKTTYKIPYENMAESLSESKKVKSRSAKETRYQKVVDLTKSQILEAMRVLESENQIVLADERVYLPDLYEAERVVAERVLELSRHEKQEFVNVEQDLAELMQEQDISLEAKQREAVIQFSRGTGGFFILNGSAGCGKTFTLNVLLRLLERQFEKINRNMDVEIFAPTGKASKVASLATGRTCVTIHRGLKYKPNLGFEFNPENPLHADVIVVDESSMIDILLGKHLLSAIQNGTKVIFLGDTKQLPSVGAGNLLLDLIESQVIKVVTLNVVKRQGADSGIIRNANRIINGEMISSAKDTQDAFVMKKESVKDAQEAILKSIAEVQKIHKYGMEDIQVLCPQKNTQIGTNVLNYLIQQRFNRQPDGVKVLNYKVQIENYATGKMENVSLYFQPGDKVIHTRNNYEMVWYMKSRLGDYFKDGEMTGIANGETGIIHDIIKGVDGESFRTRIIVRYDDRYVFYDDNFHELDHAYALSVHKSQGSQWKAVIIPMMKENYAMLDNNLFYTGYTRAQKFSVVIGQPDAMKLAIRTHVSRNRYTSLKEKILGLAS